MSPEVSVVIPLYNKEVHIRRAIDSVLKQSFQNFEIIVIDDGSRDLGASIVAEYTDDRIKLFRQENSGVSVARNRGVEAARAEIVAFLDADDAYNSEFLKNIVDIKNNNKAAVGYAMNYEVIGLGGIVELGVKGFQGQNIMLDVESFCRIGKYGSPVFSSSVAVKKSAFYAAGGFPRGVRLGEDIDTWIRMLSIGPIHFDARLGGRYYVDASNRACVINSPPARYVFFDTLDKWIQENSPPSGVVNEINEFKNSFILLHAHHHIRWGDVTVGRRVLMNCSTKVFVVEKFRLLMLSLIPRSIYELLARAKNRFHGFRSDW